MAVGRKINIVLAQDFGVYMDDTRMAGRAGDAVAFYMFAVGENEPHDLQTTVGQIAVRQFVDAQNGPVAAKTGFRGDSLARMGSIGGAHGLTRLVTLLAGHRLVRRVRPKSGLLVVAIGARRAALRARLGVV